MTQLIVLPLVASSLLILSSCGCCTGEEPAPKLRSLPAFDSLPGADPAPAQETKAHQMAEPVRVDDAK